MPTPGTPRTVKSAAFLPLKRAASRVEEHGQLFVPTRQRGLETRDAARTPDLAGHSLDPPGGDGLAASANVDFAQGFCLDEVADGVVRRFAHDNIIWLGLLLEARGKVHGVAGGHRCATERVADHDLARLDPDPCLQPDALARLRVPADLDEALADRQRGADGTFRIVLVGLRQTEDGHHRVAAELLDGAAAPLDLLGGKLEELAHESADDLRIELLAERRRSRQVREERRHDASFLYAHARDEAGAAAIAETRSLGVGRAATSAVDHGAILCVADGRPMGRRPPVGGGRPVGGGQPVGRDQPMGRRRHQSSMFLGRTTERRLCPRRPWQEHPARDQG